MVSKTDLADPSEILGVYKKAGIETFSVCCKNGEGVGSVKKRLCGGINVFTGNSGVGKSSLLNIIDPQLGLKTGEISEKLGGAATPPATPSFSSLRAADMFAIPRIFLGGL